MHLQIIKLLDLILAGLIAGVLFGIWIGYDPRGLSAQTYTEQMQSTIKALNTLMPLLGLITIVLTLLTAMLQRQHPSVWLTLLAAAAFLITAGLITKLGNQPINAVIMTWDKDHIPTDWRVLRARWWQLHTLRMLATVAAFCLIAWSNVRKA